MVRQHIKKDKLYVDKEVIKAGSTQGIKLKNNKQIVWLRT
jgi:hypothetical protein